MTQRVEVPVQLSLIDILIRNSVENQLVQNGPDTELGGKSGTVYEVVSPNRYEVEEDAKKYI